MSPLRGAREREKCASPAKRGAKRGRGAEGRRQNTPLPSPTSALRGHHALSDAALLGISRRAPAGEPGNFVARARDSSSTGWKRVKGKRGDIEEM